MIALNLLWHQHQPDYRHPTSGEVILPWVRLHAVKGYADLLAVLKRYDSAAMTVNFSGILLEQLQQYAQNGVTDMFARLSSQPAAGLAQEERAFVLKHFFSGNPRTLIRPHLRYDQLLAKRNSLVRLVGFEDAIAKFTDQELTDILVWFNLAWIGFTGQQRCDVIDLIAQGREYSHEQQLQVLEIHHEIAREVLGGYQELADQGQIELTFTPYHHPILPLLIDLAGEGHHNDADPLPDYRYPQDAEEQVRRGMHWYQQCFGRMPRGAWPAEGSVSDAALGVFASAGVEWVATDQQNLPHECRGPLDHLAPRLWQGNGSRLTVFFRDTRLADNIGFEYAGWTGRVAGRHFVNMVKAMADQAQAAEPVVTVALDGENPWEGYPDGGEGFLCALIEEVAAHPEMQFSTPGRLLAAGGYPAIDHVSAGSWINGNFDIWSRHAETRTAWRRLAQARLDLIDICHDKIYDHLLAAEGSDWFWWYGDDFNTEQAEQFDELFRAHLISAYTAAGREVPDELYAPIISERLPEAVGEISALIKPRLDGRVSSFYEWRGAVRVSASGGQSSMARVTDGEITDLWYGFSATDLYIRLELSAEWRELLQGRGGQLNLR
ncbi:hypothetical protein JW859_02770, partial [bacterium]|nr:hypothetical protein [bacterium]